MTKVTKTTIQQMPVELKGFSNPGKGNCSLGFKMEREEFATHCKGKLIPAVVFEEVCCGTRCNAELRVDMNAGGDIEGQEKLDTMGNNYMTVEALVQIPGGRVDPKSRAGTMQFVLSELSDTGWRDLERMAGRRGLLSLKVLGTIEDKRKKKKSDGKDADGQQIMEDSDDE